MMPAANSKQAPASRARADFGSCLPRPAVALRVPSCAGTGSTRQPAWPWQPASEQSPRGFTPCSWTIPSHHWVGSQWYCKDRHFRIISQWSENERDRGQTFPQHFPQAAPCSLGTATDHTFFSHCLLRSQVAFFHQTLLFTQPDKG